MSNSTHFLYSGTQERSDVGLSEEICPLCCMSLLNPTRPAIGKFASLSSTSQAAAKLLTMPLDSNDVIESCKKNTKDVADSDEEPATRAEKPVVDHMASLVMNHIA